MFCPTIEIMALCLLTVKEKLDTGVWQSFVVAVMRCREPQHQNTSSAMELIS
jgi:hypothetical protein